MINEAPGPALAAGMYCLSFRHHPAACFKLVKCKCVNIDCQDVQLKVPPGCWRWWRVAHSEAGMKFNACLLWKSITAYKLGGLLVMNGRGSWWVTENKVSPASLAPISTPLRFPLANRNILTHFVSSQKKGVFMQSVLWFTTTLLCVCRCVRVWVCVWVCLSQSHSELTLTLKSHKVTGLFGFPTNDTYAVLQAQDALQK